MPDSCTPSPRSQVTSCLVSPVSCGCGSGQAGKPGLRPEPSRAAAKRFGGSAGLSCQPTTSSRPPATKPIRLVNAVGRALEQPRAVSSGQVQPVQERPVALGRRAVTAQVDGRAVLQDGPPAVRVRGHQRRARVGVGVIGRVVEQDRLRSGLGQVAEPGGQPPAVPVVLGEQHAGPARPGPPSPGSGAAAANAWLGLAGERRGQPHDAVAMLGRQRPGRRRRAPPPRPGWPGAASRPGDLARAAGHALARHLVADVQVGDDPLQAAAASQTSVLRAKK